MKSFLFLGRNYIVFGLKRDDVDIIVFLGESVPPFLGIAHILREHSLTSYPVLRVSFNCELHNAEATFIIFMSIIYLIF